MAQVSNRQLLTVAANGQSASALAGNLDLIDRLAMSWHRRPRHPSSMRVCPDILRSCTLLTSNCRFTEHRATLLV